MNLLHEQWIGAICADGGRVKIAPWQMSDPRYLDVVAPRPDFKGALMQFLIGLLQTVCPPETTDDWAEWWEAPPEPETLKAKLESVADAFELDSEGAAFMQDYDQLNSSNPVSVSFLFIDSPGDNAVEHNTDFFIKRDRISCICTHCAATALFTSQINATGTGRGYHTSVRGWGPITTLLVTDESEGHSSLWRKLWLNILPTDESDLAGMQGIDLHLIFPWYGPTRISAGKTGGATYPEHGHPCQVYWCMPRRIRLDLLNVSQGNCHVCGEYSENLIKNIRRKQYGIDYQGAWIHPLSPYQIDPKHKTPSTAIHGKRGGITYRHWLGLLVGDESLHQQPALTVTHYIENKVDEVHDLAIETRLWTFGYDMDNQKIGKARSWNESTMPVYPFPRKHLDNIQKVVADFLEAANDIGGNIKFSLKKAWLGRRKLKDGKESIVVPKEFSKKDLFFIDAAFWQNTEPLFYITLRGVIDAIGKEEKTTALAQKWVSGLRREALKLFDQWALSGLLEDLDMKRVVKARRELQKWTYNSKKVKKLVGTQKKAAA